MNTTRLAIELFCRGFRVDPSCDLARDARGVRRTRAGLGSGLEVVLPGRRKDQWVNVPISEPFAKRSPMRLVRRGENGARGYAIVHEERREEYPVRLPPEPAWYSARTRSGREMAEIGVLQGTYLGIYVGGVCAFWSGRGLDACGFCTTGRNVGNEEALEKSVEDVVETALAAKRESGVTFVHLNTGYRGERTVEIVEPYVRALKERVGVLVGVQSTPATDHAAYDRLKRLGVDHMSFCYEFHDKAVLEQWCPGKARTVGQDLYFDAIRYCSKLFGRGTCSGEIIAGIEPVETTVRAIDWITSAGAFPTVCIFRPTLGSAMEHLPPPDPEDMVVVMRAVWEACRRHLVPVGMAPGIEVSLIVTPENARELVERVGPAELAWRAALALGRVVARPMFRRRMRPRPAAA